MTTYRAGCTDKTFTSQSCANYCHDSSSGVASFAGKEHSAVWPCGNSRFACDVSLCSISNFTVPGGILMDNAALRSDVAALTTTTTTTASATCSATSAPWRRCRGTESIATAVAVGIGVGVPLLCATAAFAALFLRERAKGRLQRCKGPQSEATTLDAWSTTQLAPLTPARTLASEPPRSEVTGESIRSEIMGTQRHELSG